MATHLFIFLLALWSLSSSSAALSIDCGSLTGFNDASGKMWIADYAETGEVQVVQKSNSVSTVMDSLRVFKSGNKNCYNMTLDKGDQLLVRASFFYGNYDKKSLPPSFDLHFDGNYWTTVETSSTKVTVYEVIYVPNGELTSVCFSLTKPGQFPFISALEATSLGSGMLRMYSHVDSDYALFPKSTLAYGASSVVRFPSDAYDRVWVPETNGYTAVASDALVVDTTTVEDHPPQDVLLNAITSSPTTDIDLVTDLPSTKVPIYITMYFSEVMELDTTQKRSFQIYKDGKPISDPILPPYRGVIEMYITNMTASSDTKFSLVATTDSDLPPIINAMEVFIVSDKLTYEKNSDDTTTTTNPSSPGTEPPPGTSKSSSGGVKTKKKSKTGAIVGGTLGAFFGFWVIAGVTALWHQRRKRAAITAMAMNGGANNKPDGV